MKTLKLIAVLALVCFSTLGQGFPKSVAKLSDLPLIQPDPLFPNVLVMGWTAAGDGGIGLYVWNSSSALSTNYGVVASSLAAGSGGQWIRQNGFGNAPARTQTLAVINSTGIIPESLSVLVAGTSGATSLTNTPTVATNGVTSGKVVRIMGTSDTDTIVVSDNGTVPGSLLELGASTRTLGIGDTLTLQWMSGKWYEIGFSNP